MKEIKLSKFGKNRGKYVSLVDDEDFEYLNQFNWFVHKVKNTLYVTRNIVVDGKQTSVYMHQIILNRKGIDHCDGNGLNNQKNNLRFCTNSENMMNRRKGINTSSIYKGVYLYKPNKKWQAHIRMNCKHISLGYFVSEIEAAKAYNAKAIELFGEFANLNIIN